MTATELATRGTYTAETPWPGMPNLTSIPSGSLRIPGMDRPAETVVGVFAALKARTEAVSQVPIRLSDRSDTIIESGDLFDLIESPNQFMDSVLYLTAIESYLALYDECLIVKVAEIGQRPDELMPLDTRFLNPRYGIHQPTGLRVVAGWDYLDPHGGATVPITWDDVIPILGFNPHAPFRGLSAMTVGKRSMQMDIASREQNLSLYLKGAIPGIALETEQRWDPDQVDEFREKFEVGYSGFSNAHRTLLLTGGIKAHTIGLKPEELQVFEGLRMTLKDIIMIMRVMPAMLGVMEGETGLSQGSSTAEQMVAWWSRTGLGELARIAVAHQIHLVDRYNWTGAAGRAPRLAERQSRDLFRRRLNGRAAGQFNQFQLWFDINQIQELVEHRMRRIDQFDKLAARGYRPDDLNDYFDLNLPEHPTNRGTLPFSLQAVEDVGLSDSLEQTPVSDRSLSPASGGDGNGLTRGPADALDSALARLGSALETRLAARHKKLRGAFDRFIAPREKKLAKRWSRHFLEQRGRVLDRLSSLRQAREARAVDESLIGLIFPKPEENQQLVALLTPLWTELAQDGWEFFNQNDVGIPAQENPFNVNDPRVMKAIEDRKIQGAKVNDTTEDDLRKIFGEIEDGATLNDLADAIGEYYKGTIGETKARPMTAARTQVAGIVNDGRMAAAREVNGLMKIWIHGSPEEARPGHVDAETKYAGGIALDEKFVIPGTGNTLDAPGDANAPISETANCTCMVGFISANAGGGN